MEGVRVGACEHWNGSVRVLVLPHPFATHSTTLHIVTAKAEVITSQVVVLSCAGCAPALRRGPATPACDERASPAGAPPALPPPLRYCAATVTIGKSRASRERAWLDEHPHAAVAPSAPAMLRQRRRRASQSTPARRARVTSWRSTCAATATALQHCYCACQQLGGALVS